MKKYPTQTNIGFENNTPLEVVEAIKSTIQDKVVCDIGSKYGDFLIGLSKYASSVIGIEQNPIAAELATNRGLDITVGNALDGLPEADVYYIWWINPSELVEKIETENIKGTFIFGNTNNYFMREYLKSKGATEEIVQTHRGDFRVIIWAR